MKRIITIVAALAFSCGFAQESKEYKALVSQANASITISKSTSNPNFIRFNNTAGLQLKSSSIKGKASEFVANYYKLFNLSSDKDLVFVNEKVDNYGLKQVTYKQLHKGVPVYDGLLRFNFDKNEQLSSINGNALPKLKVNTIANISKDEAASIAISLLRNQKFSNSKLPLEISKNNLLIFPKFLAQGGVVTPFLAYEIEITNKNDVREFLFINAHTGELVDQFTGIHNIDRKLYEINRQETNLKWKEGDAFPGALNQWQQNEVATSEHVYNFFKNAFGYISYNNNDATMVTINNNPNINCPNANWNGSTANYCNGTASDDVVAHEWGHAYTEYTSGLIYQYQSGALNESFSDVWGETIDLLNNYEDTGEVLTVRTSSACSGSSRWKMGEDATAFNGAIRDMWNPNCNGDPGYVLDAANYYCGTGDSGGVHINSGVPNHLYALLVDGGTFRGYTINKIGFVKAAHIWWRAQQNYLTATSDFAIFADALEASANDLLGVNLQGLSTTTNSAGLSGEVITAADIQSLKDGILAMQLRVNPMTQCSYQPLLAATPALCDSAIPGALFKEDWENGLGNWIVTNVGVKPSTWEARDWTVKGSLPKGRTGKAIFATDPINGDCDTDMQNGVMTLESPLISFPTYTTGKYEMAFNHYIATEFKWDGGNIKYSLNGGAWTLLPASAFSQNAYKSSLDGTTDNDNPLRGQPAFTGTDGGSLGGSWGQSVIDLSKIGVVSNSNIKFRFELGTDGCNGVEGWYVDEIYIYNCDNPLMAVNDIKNSKSLQAYPNPTSGFVKIQNEKNLKLKSAEVYSVSGQLVQTFNLSGKTKEASIDVTKLPKGTYLLKINSESESNTVKIIKN